MWLWGCAVRKSWPRSLALSHPSLRACAAGGKYSSTAGAWGLPRAAYVICDVCVHACIRCQLRMSIKRATSHAAMHVCRRPGVRKACKRDERARASASASEAAPQPSGSSYLCLWPAVGGGALYAPFQKFKTSLALLRALAAFAFARELCASYYRCVDCGPSFFLNERVMHCCMPVKTPRSRPKRHSHTL
jgi:hypothetical protein